MLLDMPDGGAEHFAKTVRHLKERCVIDVLLLLLKLQNVVLHVGHSSFRWVILGPMQIQKSANSLSVPPFFFSFFIFLIEWPQTVLNLDAFPIHPRLI